MHKCMPHRRREAWREQSPVYNARSQVSNGRQGGNHSGEGQTSGREDGSWWDDSHRSLWKEFEAEHDLIDKEFESFKRQIDADPFGALFGSRVQRLDYQSHAPNIWASIYHSLFGSSEQPMYSNTMNVGRAGKVTNHQIFPTEKPTDVVAETSRNVKAASENIPNPSSATSVPLKFDPITGRMIPKNTSPSEELPMADSVKSDIAFDIPVKKFQADQTHSSPRIPDTSVGETRESEVLGSDSQGGIGRPEEIQSPSQQSELSTETISAETNSTETNFTETDTSETDTSELYRRNENGGQDPETAQSARLAEDVPHNQFGSSKKQEVFRERQTERLQPETPIWGFWERSNLNSLSSQEHTKKENNIDGRKSSNAEIFDDPRDADLDILRSSDIRSSYGSMNSKSGLGAEKIKIRKELERDFDSCHDAEQDIDIDIHNLRSRARAEESDAKGAVNKEAGAERERIRKENIDNLVDEIQDVDEGASGKVNDQQNRVTSEESHPAEGVSQKSTSKAEAIDSSIINTRPLGTIHGSTRTDSQDAIVSSIGVEDYSASIQNHIDELLEDLREFRKSSGALLDELVQTIDRVTNVPQVGESVRPSNYKILAYDSSSSQVTDAEVTSSAHSSEEIPLLPEDVFSYLNKPAKFLPYLAELNTEGYEVVSASGDVLVFKKVRIVSTTDETTPTPSASSSSSSQLGEGQKESLDQAQSSPTQPHSYPFSPSPSSPSSSSPTMVKRQETIFTGGPPNFSPHPPPSAEPDPKNNHSSSSTGDERKKESFLHKTSRRVILTGIATAGTCYAMGVVGEYFRTGGQDGKGPEGFTAI